MALKEAGVPAQLECPDAFLNSKRKKTVDICIIPAKLFIEVDGLSHITQARQIETDIKRDFYSAKKGFDTIRIANSEIDIALEKIVSAIKNVTLERLTKD